MPATTLVDLRRTGASSSITAVGSQHQRRITDAIYGYTTKISELKMADIPETDLSKIGTHSYGDFEVCSPLSAKTQACTSSVPEVGVGGCCLCLHTLVMLQWQM